MSEKKKTAIFGPMRLPFLVLNPVCVALGAASAYLTGKDIDLFHFVLVFIGAISTHISVNALNEYDDYKSGLDFETQPTPFSGGSGTLPQHPEMEKTALFTGLLTLGISIMIGIYFLFIRGLWLLPLGVVGVTIIVTYTRWLTRNPIACLVAPGLGFGTLMVMGTHYALTGSYSWPAFFASLVPFFLVNNLLLLNQFPDMEADAGIGRKHLIIVYGKKKGVAVYGGFLFAAFASIILGVLLGQFPPGSLLGLLLIVLAVPTFIGVTRHMDDIPKLLPSLGKNVVLNILTPLLMAVGMFISV